MADQTFFARVKALLLSSFLAPYWPNVRRGTVLYWAQCHGRDGGGAYLEEDGRIAHEIRHDGDGEKERLEKRGMRFPNFEIVDATPLWCIEALALITHEPAAAGESRTRSNAKVPQALQGWTVAAVYAAQRLIDDD